MGGPGRAGGGGGGGGSKATREAMQKQHAEIQAKMNSLIRYTPEWTALQRKLAGLAKKLGMV